MQSIDQLKILCKQTIHNWIESHIADGEGKYLPCAIEHFYLNGENKYRSITHNEFFSQIEEEINSDLITFEFIGCGIKGPFNLFMYMNQVYSNTNYCLSQELKEEIINIVSDNDYLKNYNRVTDDKTCLGLYYLYFITMYKNEIYDIILDNKIKVMNQYFEI